ncbi:hypothetical protein AGABI2DRAFT_229385 [Agaricus bisporus var. bisporus H97]|uniref:hypothetical protein n=1 Tax=Agaricus bisporus var. bisporus (strain H97 / ATCC MYA-4626 / FGSC 10389) TaxID=936046 RepID=UPI00029F7FB3|nr:hypothetical protein AGABI2DRAFT_229385 [Agaricus bisporus var. bisporus H97]EKV42252.1 hypothetical protein AGABI2DRAFT_229385 [Agaricus bisporus var. bisporus H97]
MGTTRPIRPLRQTQVSKPLPTTTTIIPKLGSSMPKPLTKPRGPNMTRSRMRGVSAPPQQSIVAARGRTTSGSLSRNPSSTTLDADMAAEKRKLANVQANHALISQQLHSQGTNNNNQRRELIGYADELEQMRRKHKKEIDDLEEELVKREVETNEVVEDLKTCKEDLDRERETVGSLNETITQHTMDRERLDTQIQSLNDQNTDLQKRNEDLQNTIEDLKTQLLTRNDVLADLHKELFESEIARRKLHNMVLELKGNIRVFCRVRPILPSDTSSSSSSPKDIAAEITYPEDSKSIQLHSSTTTATGNIRHETHSFTFDRVFNTTASQHHVFEEIELLAQSCLDGHNVCIFAYGQTGSGKSYTMEGGLGEESKGMIPRAVEQVFRVKDAMKSRGWEYTVEGQFLEIYNETINDLLSSSTSAEPTKKHEIKHDLKTNTTRVTDLTIIPLTSPSQTKTLLTLANKRRSVASTLVNEHSSRSHSVFTLRISGLNVGFTEGGVEGTGERCEGCLNLVDLAGSERLNVSFGNGGRGVGKERVKETQNINKSLSALGDVIAAMGSAAGTTTVTTNGQQPHVPYRNSKLTYLLQNSLSGNSKTLMVLNLSPLAVHLNESLCSLRFATKVNNTQIGGGGVGKKGRG